MWENPNMSIGTFSSSHCPTRGPEARQPEGRDCSVFLLDPQSPVGQMECSRRGSCSEGSVTPLPSAGCRPGHRWQLAPIFIMNPQVPRSTLTAHPVLLKAGSAASGKKPPGLQSQPTEPARASRSALMSLTPCDACQNLALTTLLQAPQQCRCHRRAVGGLCQHSVCKIVEKNHQKLA